MDAVEAAVGDRAGVGDRELAGALAAAHGAGGPVPDQPRAKLGEPLRRIAAVEHVEHVLELLARELRERLGGGHERARPRRPPTRRRRPSRRGAGRGRRAGCAGSPSPRSRPRASAWRPPRTRAGRRGTSGRSGPSRPRRAGGRRGRPAAGRARPTSATRPGSPGRRAPMSIPSSSDEVATRQGSLPGLQQLLDHRALLVGERPVVGPGDLLERHSAAAWSLRLRCLGRRRAGRSFPACSVAGSSSLGLARRGARSAAWRAARRRGGC